MTREEAKHIVDVAFDVPQAVRRDGEDRTYHEDEIREAKNMAIKALEQNESAEEWYKLFVEKLEQEPCEDAISRDAVLEKAVYTETEEGWCGYTVDVDYIKSLPSVKQEPKIGHWIILPPIFEEICKCSNCHSKFKQALQISNSPCPNCGCRMVEPQESEEV